MQDLTFGTKNYEILLEDDAAAANELYEEVAEAAGDADLNED